MKSIRYSDSAGCIHDGAGQPPRWLKPGDEVKIEIEGSGRLTNPVAREPASA